MADVFLAVDPEDDEEPLVVKRILPHLAEDGTFVRMFLREARIAMAVQHENVVRINQLGEHEGLPFLQMDYVSGLTFRELATMAEEAGRTVPDGVILDLLAQAADGAHAVHETVVGEHREIVHRDLCPHNLMVNEEGVVKLLDFGIAKAAEGMDHTHTGVLKGKTTYLAPEQVRRAPVDRRTDLWTLSLVGWEMLARRRVFVGLSDYDTMQAIVGAEIPPLDQERPDLPAVIVDVIHHSLQAEPAGRFATAQELAESIRDAAAIAAIPLDRAETRAFVRELLDIGPESEVALPDLSAPASTPGVPARDFAPPPRSGPSLPPGPAAVPSTPPSQARPEKGRSGFAMAWVAFGVLATLLFVSGVAVGAFLLAPPPAPQGPEVVITLAPVMPKQEMVAELEPFRQDLEKALGQPVVLQVAPNYDAAGQLLIEKRTDFSLLPPYLYLKTKERLGDELDLLAFTEHDHSDGVDGVIIGRKQTLWVGPSDLRGSRFCFTDLRSTTGYALPRRYMRQHGIDPDEDLGEVILSGDHHQVIADVAAGRCSYGATFSGALLSAYDVDVPVQQTRQLDVTGRTPNDSICAGPGTEPGLARRVREALLSWDPEETRGLPHVGDRQHLTGFTPGSDDAYDGLRKALEVQ